MKILEETKNKIIIETYLHNDFYEDCESDVAEVLETIKSPNFGLKYVLYEVGFKIEIDKETGKDRILEVLYGEQRLKSTAL